MMSHAAAHLRRWIGAVALACLCASSASAHQLHFAQSDMPVIPPPSQRQPPPVQPSQPGGPSIEDLARQGFDVKAIERVGQAEGRYVVMMQRAGEVRTCLMRIEMQRGQTPRRPSACF